MAGRTPEETDRLINEAISTGNCSPPRVNGSKVHCAGGTFGYGFDGWKCSGVGGGRKFPLDGAVQPRGVSRAKYRGLCNSTFVNVK